MEGWETVALTEIATQINRPIEVVPGKSYRTMGVKWWGQGAYERTTIDGSNTAAKTLSIVRSHDLVINKIWVRHGSTAIAGPEVDGCTASGEFPTFELDLTQVLPKWLHWLVKTRTFWSKCDALSRGTSGKNRIKPELFLSVRIPLPPLAEQRRIVARIEALAAEIDEAKRLRREAVEEAGALTLSATEKLFVSESNWTIKETQEFCELPQYGYTESATVEPVGPHFLRITDIQNRQVNWDRVPYCRCPEPSNYLLKPGDLVFARTGATTGKSFVIGDCPETVFASYLIRLRVRDTVLVEYLYSYFQSPGYWQQITDKKEGTGQPNVNGKKLSRLKVPVPPLPEQRRIVAEFDALQAEVDALKHLQSETAAELDALLPAILDRAFKGEL